MDAYRRFSNAQAYTKCPFKEIIIIMENSTESTFLKTIHSHMANDISFLRVCDQGNSNIQGDVQIQSSSRFSQTQPSLSTSCKGKSFGPGPLIHSPNGVTSSKTAVKDGNEKDLINQWQNKNKNENKNKIKLQHFWFYRS